LRSRLGLAQRLSIVYTGTFEAYQGLDLLLDSTKFVVSQELTALFIWVGGRPDQVKHWQTRVDANQLQNHVLLVGSVPPAEALAYLEAADIAVSPRRDGTSIPLKIYTYLQSGKPLVVTNSLAHTQVLSADTAILVDPTPEALAAGILRLAVDPALGQALGARARALALEKFSAADHLEKLADLYQSLEVPAGRAPDPVPTGPSK
jgi:glycosyltransferase involved in cell wall biosynthesis